MKNFTEQLEGSGEGSLEENQRALDRLEGQMEVLRQRSANGENVSQEVSKLIELKNRLLEDRGRINLGGM